MNEKPTSNQLLEHYRNVKDALFKGRMIQIFLPLIGNAGWKDLGWTYRDIGKVESMNLVDLYQNFRVKPAEQGCANEVGASPVSSPPEDLRRQERVVWQKPDLVDWSSPKDVPMGCIIRALKEVDSDKAWFVVISALPTGVMVSIEGQLIKLPWATLSRYYEFTDDGEMWQPCRKRGVVTA